MGFQTQVNIQLAFGVAGALYDDSPMRASRWALNSSNAANNLIGSTALTLVSADPGNSEASGVAQAGGSGMFVGILANTKTAVTSGTTGGALNPTVALPNWAIQEAVSFGHLIVNLPGPANPGDKVCFDQSTGQLSTYPALASFTASLAQSTGILTVSAITAGFLQPGMILNGLGVSGVAITAYDAGAGGTGTYYTNYTGGAGNISSEAMTAKTLPPVAASFDITGISTSGVMTVSTVHSGNLGVGQVITGTGIPANTVITGFVSGEGGTGTYNVYPAPANAVGAETNLVADQQIAIPAEVILFQPAGNGGLGVISLNAA